MKAAARLTRILTAFVAGALLVGTPCPANPAELKQKTNEAFERYSRVTELRIETELRAGNPFLWADSLPEPRREAVLAQLKRGEVAIEELKTLDAGKKIDCPAGMIHHWIGIVFVPGVTLEQALALVKDYDNHQEVYKPDVMRSKTLSHEGNDFRIFLRFLKKKVLTAVLNTEHDVRYFPVDATHAHSRSYTTRIAEVVDSDKPDGSEKPVGKDRGFLWRMNTYWRFEERDGGTYVQCESISLSRDLPPLIGVLIKGFVKSVPRESLTFTLGTTRKALLARHSAGSR